MPHFGVLNVNKPPNCTSRDVVDHVERIIRPTRAGHAGTLDPLATGVLVICVGQATRLIQHVQRMPKHYLATFLLGYASDTDDTESQVTPVEGARQIEREMIEAVVPQFMGEIQQRPPDHSAVKIGGRRAYKLARQGKPFEIAARPVTVHRLTVLRFEYPELGLEIVCGSGTYIRSLGRDLAAALGTTAVMSALQRMAIGGFRVEDAVVPNYLTTDSLAQHLQPALAAVVDLPRLELDEPELDDLRHGRPIPSSVMTGTLSSQTREWAALDRAGGLAAILYEKYPGQLWPVCNFQS